MTDVLPEALEARRLLEPFQGYALDDERALILFAFHAWSCLVEPGDSVAGRLVALLGPVAALAEIGGSRSTRARDAAGIGPKEWHDALQRWRPRLAARPIRDALEIARHAGVSLIARDDPLWPVALDDLGFHAPFVLWVRGHTGALTRATRSVAMVGARAATSYGEHVTMEIAGDLVGRGVSVVAVTGGSLAGCARSPAP